MLAASRAPVAGADPADGFVAMLGAGGKGMGTPVGNSRRMTETDAAEVWIKQQLALADAAVEMHPLTARDLTLEQYERQLRQAWRSICCLLSRISGSSTKRPRRWQGKRDVSWLYELAGFDGRTSCGTASTSSR